MTLGNHLVRRKSAGRCIHAACDRMHRALRGHHRSNSRLERIEIQRGGSYDAFLRAAELAVSLARDTAERQFTKNGAEPADRCSPWIGTAALPSSLSGDHRWRRGMNLIAWLRRARKIETLATFFGLIGVGFAVSWVLTIIT
jgi:hypothetical protein